MSLRANAPEGAPAVGPGGTGVDGPPPLGTQFGSHEAPPCGMLPPAEVLAPLVDEPPPLVDEPPAVVPPLADVPPPLEVVAEPGVTPPLGDA
jgi:hypothetical protein